MNLSLPKDKAGQNKLALAVLPFVIFGAYYYFLHGKTKAEITTLETRLEEVEKRNSTAKAIALSGGTDLQQKLALYEQHMKRLEELIPKSEEVASLLNGLSERAIDADVDLSLMKPELSEPGEFYTEQTYQVQVIGLYHNIGRYLAAIASGPRIVTPIGLKLRPRPPAEMTRDGTPRLNAEFRILTYVIPPTAETTPAQGGANGTH
ncbi:MAG TPA: type 4a pilus biogenesis protein PilO [Longimicrobiales bacterium]